MSPGKSRSDLGVLYRKELAALFFSPTAYVIVGANFALISYAFSVHLAISGHANIAQILIQAAQILILSMPFLTMRQIAGEKLSGTLELLQSHPVSELTIVAAKFFADLSLIVILLLCLLILPWTLSLFAAVSWQVVITGYIGLFSLAAALIAIGLMVSACTDNTVVVAVCTYGIFLSLWMTELASFVLPSPLDEFAINLSFDTHFTPFVTGVVYVTDIGFFLSIVLVGLLFSVMAIARR